VVVRDGLIEAVGAGVAIPPDAWVIEGAGLTVYPGFTDAWSTWGIPRPAERTRGVKRRRGQPRLAWRMAYSRRKNSCRRRSRASGGRGMRICVGGGISARGSSRTGAWLNLAGEQASQMVVAAPVGQHLSLRAAGSRAIRVRCWVRSRLSGRCIWMGHHRAAKEMYEKNPRGMRRPGYDRALEGVLQSPRRCCRRLRRWIWSGWRGSVRSYRPRPFCMEGTMRHGNGLIQASKFPVLVSLKWPRGLRTPIRRWKTACGRSGVARGGSRSGGGTGQGGGEVCVLLRRNRKAGGSAGCGKGD
jgi:hypothetical protein